METIPTQNRDIAKEAARDHYLGMMMIIKADRKHYGGLIASLKNQHNQNIQGYPVNSQQAYQMLVDYVPTNNLLSQYDNDGGGISYVQYDDDKTTDDSSHGTAHSGRGGGRSSGVVVVQVADMLVKLVISLKPYLMIVKCQNPILCLLSMTCEMGNCSSQKDDLQHYQIPGCLLIVVLQLISFPPQAYYMGYIKLSTPYVFAAMLG